MEVWRYRGREIWRYGVIDIWRYGDKEIYSLYVYGILAFDRQVPGVSATDDVWSL